MKRAEIKPGITCRLYIYFTSILCRVKALCSFPFTNNSYIHLLRKIYIGIRTENLRFSVYFKYTICILRNYQKKKGQKRWLRLRLENR